MYILELELQASPCVKLSKDLVRVRFSGSGSAVIDAQCSLTAGWETENAGGLRERWDGVPLSGDSVPSLTQAPGTRGRRGLALWLSVELASVFKYHPVLERFIFESIDADIGLDQDLPLTQSLQGILRH